MPVWEEALSIKLPYTNAAACYKLVEKYPEIKQAFFEQIVPLAEAAGDVSERVQRMEAAREKTLEDYQAGGRSLREVDTALNCVMADLYMGLFMSAAERIRQSKLSPEKKSDGIEILRDAVTYGMAWNKTKQTEIDLLLDGAEDDDEDDE